MRPFRHVFLLAALAAAPAGAWQIEVPRPGDAEGAPGEVMTYTPLDRAARDWTLCVAYPHLKDSYWLSVNHGMVEEARRLGVSFRLVEAGGYPNLERQRQQVLDCVAEGADALILGTVSFDGMTPTVEQVAQRIPVIAAVNDIAGAGVTAKVGVSWTRMGAVAGEVVASRHPAGTAPVKLAWFPGPEGAGWVRFVEAGFRQAIEGSAVEIAVTKHGDTGREIQVTLVEEALDAEPDLAYLVGAAPAAEVAVSLLRTRGAEGRVQIVSDYMTHAIYRGIYRGKILASPTDFPVLQGRMAIEFAVRALEGTLVHTDAGPQILAIQSEDLSRAQLAETLAPASFVPVFKFPQ